jgi:hypothetical protein
MKSWREPSSSWRSIPNNGPNKKCLSRQSSDIKAEKLIDSHSDPGVVDAGWPQPIVYGMPLTGCPSQTYPVFAIAYKFLSMRLPQLKLHCRSFTVFAMFALVLAITLPFTVRAAASELSISPNHLSYGDVVVDRTHQQTVTLINSGHEKVTISGVSSNEKDFKVSGLTLPKVLTPGERLKVTVTFSPTAKGVVNGRIVFASNASDRSLAIPVAGTGTTSAEVIAAPPSVTFGDVGVGESSTLPVTLTNTGGSKVTLESSQITGSVFSLSGARFPLVLAAKQSVKLDATFKPKAAGTIDGDVIFSGPALKIPLTGTGTSSSRRKRELTLAPNSLNFGNVGAGTTETLTVGLKASGSSVTVSAITSSNSQFEVSGEALPLTIPAGQEKLINVTFKPQGSGTKSATLSTASNAADSKASEALTGTGTAPYVDLSWKPSTSTVKGYNVYRSKSATGSYARINSSVDVDTAYEDSTIASGNTYYYATTAVSASGEESGYSNRVEVVVP